MIKFSAETGYYVGAVHFYYLKFEGKNILIDTGPPTDEAKEIYLKYIDLLKLDYVLLTHIHIDHAGMVSFISNNSDATIYISENNAFLLENRGQWANYLEKLLDNLGFTDSFTKQVVSMLKLLRDSIPIPRNYSILERGNIIYNLGVDYIKTPYHSQSDVIYLIDRFAFTGDALLRDTFQTPLIDIDYKNPDIRYNNYLAFCTSLYKMEKLINYLVMPGHHDYITSVNKTILFYIEKFLTRIIKIKDIIRDWHPEKIIDYVVKNDNIHVKFLKAGEIFFFKDFLKEPKKLKDALTYLGLFDDRVSDIYEKAIN
ncbi:MAG: MBL fold metallo-hydrolase [Deferribacterota bacterium]|nr:MBL fold metallo-hydrolase [Deferribacterota bacterium]